MHKIYRNYYRTILDLLYLLLMYLSLLESIFLLLSKILDAIITFYLHSID